MTMRGSILAVALLAGLGMATTAGAQTYGGGDKAGKSKSGHAAATGNIVQVAEGAGSFRTLLTALNAAGLAETLKGEGPFTVFAPTDAAFAKLPAGTLDALLKDPERLRAVLTYHVVAGKVKAKQVMAMQQAATVNGAPVAIRVHGGGVMVGGAMVQKADVMASNGVIHVIDTVLLPPERRQASE